MKIVSELYLKRNYQFSLRGDGDFFEVKRNAAKFDAALLRYKAEEFLTAAGEFAPYEKAFSGLSMTDM